MQSQVIEHPFCFYQSVVWRWGGKGPPARTEVLHLLSSLPGLPHTYPRKYSHICTHICKHAHIHTLLEMDKYMYTCIHIHTHIYKPTHTLIHTHVYAYIYQKHTHVQSLAFSKLEALRSLSFCSSQMVYLHHGGGRPLTTFDQFLSSWCNLFSVM